MMRSSSFYLFLLLGTTPVTAKDLGNHGQTFAIAEEDLSQVIARKLKGLKPEEIACHQQDIARKAARKIREPLAVSGITSATKPRRWLYDPSFTVPEDIKDHEDKVIVAKGAVANNLKTMSWGVPLLFLDGDDALQIAWASAQDPHAKWVLVKGKPLALEERLNRPIYFDQAGKLTQTFGITQVPCRVTQQGLKLLVEEIVIKGVNS